MGISSGRIVDRAGAGRLPVGIEDFERVVREFVYVDKSLMIRELIDANFNAVLFCRPRRFGKSLAMRMLQCYFEAPVPGARAPIAARSGLFEGLAISEAGERYEHERGAHPVVFLSLTETISPTWEKTRDLLAIAIAGECKRHDYLLDDPSVAQVDKDMLRRLVQKRPAEGELESSLAWLSDLLAQHHGTGTVILIDEYDAPVTQGHLRGFRDEATDFMRTWLTGALKATTSLYLGVMTGVQRVSRESIFSGLHNIVVDTALDHEFPKAFGFTEAEAIELAEYAECSKCVEEMRDWYDGYVFGGERVYNPWSLLSYLAKGGVAQPYWGNTSSNAVVHDLFRRADGATAGELAAPASGEAVRERIDLATVFDMLDGSPQAIWSQLYLSGYLTTEDTQEPNNVRLPRELRVPNREVGQLFRDEFYERSTVVAGGRAHLDELHVALTSGNVEVLEDALRCVLLNSPSALDLVRENSYHMLLVGLTYSVYGYRFPVSNREAGDGRADVALVPESENVGRLPGLVIEVKHGRRADGTTLGDEELMRLAGEALAQIERCSYDDVLPAGTRLAWGIAFSGKQVSAVCKNC